MARQTQSDGVLNDTDRPRRSRVAPVAAGLVLATLVLAPLAAWFHSRATQDRLARQTADRLRR